MITYIMISGIIGSFVFSTRVPDMGGDILSGKIINYITKPISILDYLLSREAADKLINLLFGVTEVILFITIFKPHIYIQTNIIVYVILLLYILMAALLAFFISYLLAMIAFWSNEVWAPRYIYIVISSILAGTAFPLDILPKFMYEIFMLTPFPYLLFIPIKIYLQGFSFNLIKPSIVLIVWMMLLYFFSKFIWNKGMREFSFFGK
jgi:ABC-2 type transport system permease protein